MDTLTVTLLTGDSLVAKKEDVKFLFPESLFSSLIDQGYDQVNIENSVVTPEILGVISHLLTNKTLIGLPLRLPNMTEVAKYLGLDILALLSDPKFHLFRRVHPEINIVDPEERTDQYSNILSWAIENDDHMLATYVCRSVPTDVMDPILFVVAAIFGRSQIVALLLRRPDVDPRTAKLSNNDYNYYVNRLYMSDPAQIYRYVGDSGQSLFAYDAHILEDAYNQALSFALKREHSATVEVLLGDPRTTYLTRDFLTEENYRDTIFKYADTLHSAELMDRLISDPRFELEDIYDQVATGWSGSSLIPLLLTQPKYQLEDLVNTLVAQGLNIDSHHLPQMPIQWDRLSDQVIQLMAEEDPRIIIDHTYVTRALLERLRPYLSTQYPANLGALEDRLARLP